MADGGFIGGFLRLSFSFSAGLLISRTFRHRHIPASFWICTVILAALMSCPYFGGNEPTVLNGIYDSVATLIVFPAVVYIGACGVTTDSFSTRVCNFLGAISYPLYIIHYPFMYLFYAWVWNNGLTFGQVWPVCALMFVALIAGAWIILKYYDEPVRRWLTQRLLHNRAESAVPD